MAKYIYDKASGQVVEKPEKQPESGILPLPFPNPPPAWFVDIYETYLDEVRKGGRP